VTEHLDDDDPVARNRSLPRRATPGRRPVGTDVARRLGVLTVVVLAGITALLIVSVVLFGGP
jgi:hypothetical protein